jgi:FtsH-binding integral membrane protein
MENNFEQYQEPRVLVAHAGQLERAAFYRKTYQHVALSVLAFILVESMFLKIPALVEFMLSMTQGYLWLLLLGAFWLATSMADKLAHDVSQTKQYIGLGIYVVFYALIFIPLLYIAIYYIEGGTALINQAAVITLSLFSGLTAVVFMTKTDFSFLKSAITIGVFIAMGLIVAGIIFGFDLGLWFSFGMVALAGAAILYQTSKLKNEYEVTQYVGASLGLFASLMLMFWYVLQILMSRD